MSAASVQMAIDNRWIPCQLSDEFGLLGVRYLCDLGSAIRGQQGKRLLVRPVVWPQTTGQAVGLACRPLAQGQNLGLRQPTAKVYNQVLTQPSRQQRQESCQVIQQDISGLISLRQAVHDAARAGDARRLRRLFFRACKSLENFGKLAGVGGRAIPLQCPPGLAVEASSGRVVPLDAEIQSTGAHPQAVGAYARWFGRANAGGAVADNRQAAMLHARAVFQYFRELLASVQAEAPPLPPGLFPPVDEETTFEEPDWERWFEEEAQAAAAEEIRGPEPIRAVAARPRRTWAGLLLRISLLLNLLLTGILLVLLVIWPRVVGALTGGGGLSDSSLLFSTYCVVFPTEGTVGNKVNTAVQELFPGRVLEIKPGGADHDKMRQEKLTAAIKAIPDQQRLMDLLARLGSENVVRFKGFTAGDANETLSGIIGRGGIFALGGPSREQYGSLLQPNGLEKVLTQAGLSGQREPRALLEALRKAVVEYASLVDALKIVDRRHAFLLSVEPTPAAHDEVRRRLLSRLDNPVFLSRPITELFDAVDPTEDVGAAAATYTLKLDQPCYWRLVGNDDRARVNFAVMQNKERMKWIYFPAGQTISWKPILLPLRSGGADNVVTFDIAVLLDGNKPKGRVVLFRNQRLLLGDSQQQVLALSRDYIEKSLQVPIAAAEDAVRVRKQGEQYTATLLYSYLAEQVPAGTRRTDVQITDWEAFQNLQKAEDNF